jgi:3-hydroxyisobutyrate dehydrogenase-like beta-hydroxyacid dehydrogenase
VAAEGDAKGIAVGVVGLGNIGGAIAANLVADGHRVLVADADAERAGALDGADASDVEAIAGEADVTFLSLPTPEDVAGVATRWAAVAPAGAVLVDLSTTLPDANRALAAQLAASGHHFVEAPLTGGAIGARNRALVFMVGGEPEPVARVTPLLDALGRATVHLGPVGTGSTMKLVNSLLAFTCTWASLEGLSLAAAAGIDLRAAVEVVRTGGASNFYIDRGVEGIGNRGQPPQFALALAAKDAGLIKEAAAASGVPSAMADAMVSVLADVVERGLGDHDWSDLVVAAEARASQSLVLGPPAGGEG